MTVLHIASRPEAARTVVLFVALLATALALGPALAHAFSLANKMTLSRDEYFIAQKAYAGWNRFAYLLAIQFVAVIALGILCRDDPIGVIGSVTALACLVGAQVLFWLFTYPANVATMNWTEPPTAWEALRRQWEYSHAAGAVLQVVALCALLVVAVRGPPTAEGGHRRGP